MTPTHLAAPHRQCSASGARTPPRICSPLASLAARFAKNITPPRLAARMRSRLADPPPPGEGGDGTLSASLRVSKGKALMILLRWRHEHRHPPLEGEGRRRANARRRGGVIL